MTPIIKYFQQYSILVLLSVVLISAFWYSDAQAQISLDRIQRIYTPNPVKIPADRDGAFRLYFPYNNPLSVSMDNVVAEIRIEGSGFVFIPDESYDYYNPGSSDIIECNKLSQVPAHKISVPLTSSSSIVYGLQSADSIQTATGDTVGILVAGTSGCLQVTMAVDPNIIVGQTASVYMNWYTQGELDSNKLPPVGLYNLIAVVGKSTAQECLADEELRDGICVKSCTIGKVRDSLGVCVDQSSLNSTVNKQSWAPSNVPEFDLYVWMLSIFGAALLVSLCILSYSIVVYHRLHN